MNTCKSFKIWSRVEMFGVAVVNVEEYDDVDKAVDLARMTLKVPADLVEVAVVDADGRTVYKDSTEAA